MKLIDIQKLINGTLKENERRRLQLEILQDIVNISWDGVNAELKIIQEKAQYEINNLEGQIKVLKEAQKKHESQLHAEDSNKQEIRKCMRRIHTFINYEGADPYTRGKPKLTERELLQLIKTEANTLIKITMPKCL